MIAKDSVEKFVAYWRMQSGSERSQCHQFWDSLLGEVLGVTDLKWFIEYEKPVYFNDGTTKSLNAWIPATKVHMAWMRTVCGRLKSDYRYSKEIVYNPFPWPDVKLGQTGCDIADVKSEIERTAQAILDARQKYAGASFAELYGEKMYLFADLVAAHEANDAAVLKACGWTEDGLP